MEDQEKRYKKIVEMAKIAKSKEKQIDESYGASDYAQAPFGSGRRVGGPKPSIMSPETHAVDDLDVGPICELDDPDTLARINMYLSQANGTTNNPWRIIKNIQYKFHIVGLNFKIPGTTELPLERTTYEFELIKHGGDFGPMPDGEWKDGVGFDRGYLIKFDIDPTGDYVWNMHAEVIFDDDAVGGEDESFTMG